VGEQRPLFRLCASKLQKEGHAGERRGVGVSRKGRKSKDPQNWRGEVYALMKKRAKLPSPTRSTAWTLFFHTQRPPALAPPRQPDHSPGSDLVPPVTSGETEVQRTKESFTFALLVSLLS
jgi:hypothetical protein